MRYKITPPKHAVREVQNNILAIIVNYLDYWNRAPRRFDGALLVNNLSNTDILTLGTIGANVEKIE